MACFSKNTSLRFLSLGHQVFVQGPTINAIPKQASKQWKTNLFPLGSYSLLLILATQNLAIRMCFCLKDCAEHSIFLPFIFHNRTQIPWTNVLSLRAKRWCQTRPASGPKQMKPQDGSTNRLTTCSSNKIFFIFPFHGDDTLKTLLNQK